VAYDGSDFLGWQSLGDKSTALELGISLLGSTGLSEPSPYRDNKSKVDKSPKASSQYLALLVAKIRSVTPFKLILDF